MEWINEPNIDNLKEHQEEVAPMCAGLFAGIGAIGTCLGTGMLCDSLCGFYF